MTNRMCKGLVGAMVVLAGCNGDLREEVANIPPGLRKEPYAFQREGEPQAKYVVAHVSPGPDGTVITINLRHSAQSGFTFTRLALRCESGENRVLASANTYEGLKTDNHNSLWSGLMEGSSRYFVAKKACSVTGRNFGV